MVKANVNVGHDVICGPLCHFAMGSIVGSYTKIGCCSDVAIGSVLLEKRSMGDYAMLGAHSLATSNIPDNEIYVGSPAKHFRYMTDNQQIKLGGVAVDLFAASYYGMAV